MLTYEFEMEKDDNGTFLLIFPDIPGALSVVDADKLESAQQNALEGLLATLDGYIEIRKPIPLPSAIKNPQQTVTLPALETTKVFLLNEMIAQGVKKSEMARRLNVHTPQIDRLLDLRHNTKLDFLEKAASKLGKHLNISFS